MIRRLFRSRRARVALLLASLFGLGWASFEAVTRSQWMGDQIREAMVAGIEAVTGGTVSIERVTFGTRRLDLKIEGLVLRDGEGTESTPFAEVPVAWVEVGWRSLLGGRTYLHSLRMHNPRVRAYVRDDGSSNIPWPQSIGGDGGITVRQIEITGGSVEWDGEPYGIEFEGTGLSIEVAFDPTVREYFIEAELAEAIHGPAGSRTRAVSAVDVSATAGKRGIEVHSATLRSEAIFLEIRDALLDLAAPRIEGQFAAETRLADFASYLGTELPGLTGRASAGGLARWSPGNRELDYEADVSVREAGAFGLGGPGVLECSLAGNLERLDITGIRGDALGGEVDGTVSVRGLGDSPEISASGSVSSLSIAALAQAAGMESFVWDGLLDLAVESSGKPRDGLVTSFEFGIRPTIEPSQLPLEGSGSFLYAGGSGDLSISALRLSFGHGQAAVKASGLVSGSGEADLSIESEIGSKQAAAALLALLDAELAIPDGMPDGRVAFAGDLQGPLGNPADLVLDGDFSLQEFDLGGQRWDRVSFLGRLSAAGIEIIEGEAVDGDGRLNIQGKLPLIRDRTVDLEVSGQGFDARKLGRASGFGLPIEGSVAIEASLSGPLGDPTASSRVRVDSPTFFGEDFDGLEAEIRYGSGRFELPQATIRRGESNLRVTGTVNRSTQEVTLAMAGTHWQLETFDIARALMPGVTGTVEFDLEAAGIVGGARQLTGLELDGHWEIPDLRRMEADLGHWTGTINSSSERENIDFFWSANVLGGVIRGEGALWQNEAPSYNGTVDFRQINLGRLWQSLEFPESDLDGSVTGTAQFEGVLDAPGTFEVVGTVEQAELAIGPDSDDPVTISNVFPMRWSVRDGAVRFDSMSLGGAGTDFSIDGAVGLTGERVLDLSLDGSVNLLLLQGLLPGTGWEGTSRIGLKVLGTLDEPSVEGSMEFVEAGMSPSDFPLRLSDLTGTVLLENGEGRIENVRATSGGGSFRFDGAVAYGETGLEYRLHARAEDVRLDYPGRISSVIDGDLTLAGVGLTSFLSGNLLVTRMSIGSGVSFGDLFSSLNRPPGNSSTSQMLQGMQLSLNIGAVPNLAIDTDLVRNVAADLDLEVLGTVASPSLLGTVGVVQGELRMLGTHYQVNRGDIRFVNPLQAEPVLDVELETRIRDIDLELVLSGPAGALDLSYRSDPPLPFHDLVSLIAVGKEPTVDPSIASQRRIQQQSLVQTGADALLSQAIAEPVNRRLQRFFGVSRIKVDPQVGGLEANPNPRISTEQQIGEDVTLIYSYDLSAAQQQSIRIEWNPGRRWSFLITRDQNGLVGSDVLFKVRLP